MQSPIVTLKQVRRFDPCCSEGDVTAIAAGRESESLAQLAKELSPDDWLWLALREEYISSCKLRRLASDFAERALCRERDAGREPKRASWDAVAVARRYADGLATSRELAAAHIAVFDASQDVALGASQNAAQNAVLNAARAVERSAARAAARAAWAAALEAAWTAEWEARVAEWAAREAARSAALEAAWTAEWEARAAEWAAREAARGEERRWQVHRVIETMGW